MRTVPKAVVAAALGLFALGAQADLIFRAGSSSVKYTHEDKVAGTNTDSDTFTGNTAIGYDHLFTFGGTGSTTGQGIVTQVTSGNVGAVGFGNNTGVNQSDPPSATVHSSVSRLTIDFKLAWDVSGSAPTNGNFSVPVQFSVGKGSGAFSAFNWDVHWDIANSDNTPIGELRNPYSGSFSLLSNGVSSQTLTKTFTAPADGLAPLANGDRIILSGKLVFSANNPATGNEPIDQIDPETRDNPDDHPTTPSSTFIMVPDFCLRTDVSVDAGFCLPGFTAQSGDPVGYGYAFASFDTSPVPLPSVAFGGIGLLAMTSLRRRRRTA